MMDTQAPVPQSPRVANSHLVPPSHVHLEPPPTTTFLDSNVRGNGVANSSSLKRIASAEKSRPLRLLSLPVDVLKEIIKEVGLTHGASSTNLCRSTSPACIPG